MFWSIFPTKVPDLAQAITGSVNMSEVGLVAPATVVVGNGELGTGNQGLGARWELGTVNWEPGTANWELGPGN